jgi:biopolymer transport protein ExbD
MMEHHLRNRAEGELNLIPMIDILSVLVSFLLVYSTEVEIVQNSKGIEIPESIVTTKPRESVVVMVTREELLVQGERIASLDELRADRNPVFEPLQQVLARPRMASGITLEDQEVTVMADKTLNYDLLKKVMQTATEAGFGKLSFATIEKDKAVEPGAAAP